MIYPTPVRLGVAALLAALGACAQAQETIKLGALATLEGPFTVLGQDGIRGVELALRDVVRVLRRRHRRARRQRLVTNGRVVQPAEQHPGGDALPGLGVRLHHRRRNLGARCCRDGALGQSLRHAGGGEVGAPR